MEEELIESLELQHSDDEPNVPAVHGKLLGAISKLYDRQRIKTLHRNEPTLGDSEVHVSEPNRKRDSHIKLTRLTRRVNKRAAQTAITQKLKSAQKRAKTLPKPLEKIDADRITRAAGYEHAKHQLNRWDAIVYKQQVADQLTFPLKSETVKIHESPDILKMFRKPTELEIKMAELLKHPDPLAQKKEEEYQTKDEEKEEDDPITMAEVVERRKSMARLRAQQSYKQVKAIRHSKIKSKKFHQIQRRARVKEQLREFEELQKKDPEAALKKLEELERTRAEERVTLRHRSTGQWAKNLSVRAKYDKEARIALAEQLSKSRELTVKLAKNSDTESEKEEEEEVQHPEPAEQDPNNPWVVKRSREMEDFVSGYRKYWENNQKELDQNQATAKTNNFQVEDGRLKKTDASDKNNVCKKSDIESKLTLDNVENSNNEPHHQRENVISPPNKNKFTINGSCIKNNIKKTRSKRLSTFDISNVLQKTNNVNTTLESGRPRTRDTALKSTTMNCKTGSWTVTTRNVKKTKDIKYTKSMEIHRLNGSSESKISTEVKNTEERRHKIKSLDELFEEVEDKLQSKVKDKLEKMKENLTRKRRHEIENNTVTEDNDLPSLQLKKTNIAADVDEELLERSAVNSEEAVENNLLSKTVATASADVKAPENVNPKHFKEMAPRYLSSKLPDVMTEGEDALDDEETTAQDRCMTLSEAYAEDDIIDQFQKDKEEEEKKTGVEGVDLSLPGWGSWAGHNIKPMSRRRRKKFVIKFPKAIPRRDTNRGNVIINEDADKPLKEHQVSEVPFPFTSVKEFEASIRAPLGSTWMPQTAHQKLTMPPIVTRLGAVIEPMDETQLVIKDKDIPTNKVHKNKKDKRQRMFSKK